MRQPAVGRVETGSTADTVRLGQRSVALIIVAGVALLAALFHPEVRAAIDVWNASTAYSHCYLVLPMTLYLLWERRRVLQTVGARPEPILALGAIPVAIVWLLAERLGVMEGRQLAAIASVQVLLCSLLGRRLYWRLSGPLLFLFFLVPFGAFLTPMLQRFTAAFSIMGLDILGIPNYSDRFTIETPAGVFFVAEACAGLRFLIAAIAFGVFYALLNYTSPARRAGFIAASIVVPIIANGFRALGIVVLGQILGSAEAAAADHIIYGWVFFSVVMLLLIAGGQAFREPEPSWADVSQTPITHPASWASYARAALAAILLVAIGPIAAGVIDSRSTPLNFADAYVFSAPPGCVVASQTGPATQRMTVMDCNGTKFEWRLSVFPVRSTSSALVIERRRVTQEIGAEDVTLVSAEVPPGRGMWAIAQTTEPNRVTAYASWVDGAPVSNATAGRIAQARDSLFGGDHVAALITVTSAEMERSAPAQRKAVLDRLVSSISSQVDLDANMERFTRLPRG